MNKKRKKNDVINKDNTKSPTNYIIISHSLFSDKHDKIALPSECALSSNDIEQSVASKINTINNNMDQHPYSATYNSKVNKKINTLSNNIIDEIEFNNSIIKDKVKGILNMFINVHSDINAYNKNDLSSTVIEVDEELKDNNIKSTSR